MKRLWARLPVKRGPKSTIRLKSARTRAGLGSGTVRRAASALPSQRDPSASAGAATAACPSRRRRVIPLLTMPCLVPALGRCGRHYRRLRHALRLELAAVKALDALDGALDGELGQALVGGVRHLTATVRRAEQRHERLGHRGRVLR